VFWTLFEVASIVSVQTLYALTNDVALAVNPW
jgi:hypothetical protein